MEQLYATRRKNLKLLVDERFRGNQTAAAVEVGIHPNHFNLMVSSNTKTQRNTGETLARKIEEGLGLPERWLDSPQTTASYVPRIPTTIPAQDVSLHMRGLLRRADCDGVIVSPEWMTKLLARVSSIENLNLVCIDTEELVDQGLTPDCRVIVDHGARGRILTDGVYVFYRSAKVEEVKVKPKAKKGNGQDKEEAGRAYHMRRFRANPLTGSWTVEGGGLSTSLDERAMLHLTSVAKVVAIVPTPTLL